MGILYHSTKFELDRLINNGDLLPDRILWKHRHTCTQTDTQTHTDRLNLILYPYII